jgi:putative membrane protein insertion efficiency factor
MASAPGWQRRTGGRSSLRGGERDANASPRRSRRNRRDTDRSPHIPPVMPDSETPGFRQGFSAGAKPAHGALSPRGSTVADGGGTAGTCSLAQGWEGARPKPGKTPGAGALPPPPQRAFPGRGRSCGRQTGRVAVELRGRLTGTGRRLGRLASQFAVGAVIAYQRLLSPLHPPSCRFYPSCSAYALAAYREFGFCLATWLSVRRLLRCHPFHPGGFDPLPPATRSSAWNGRHTG